MGILPFPFTPWGSSGQGRAGFLFIPKLGFAAEVLGPNIKEESLTDDVLLGGGGNKLQHYKFPDAPPAVT